MQINSTNTWSPSFKHNVVQILGIVLLICFAATLTTHTLLLQNSCTPLLEWTDISQRNCSTKISGPVKKGSSKLPGEQPKKGSKAVIRSDSKSTDLLISKPNSNNAVKEIISLAAGSIAVAGLAVVEAPVVVIAGVGFALWLAARTVLSSGQ